MKLNSNRDVYNPNRMSKHLRHIVSLSLILCLILYSAGNAAIKISCPNETPKTGTSHHNSHDEFHHHSHHKSKHGENSDEQRKGCCTTIIEKNIVRPDFEIPLKFKYFSSYQLIVSVGATALDNYQYQFSPQVSFLTYHVIPSCVNSRERCVLLSTFLI